MDERAILRELRSNLSSNVAELESDLEFDSVTIVGIENILAHLDGRLAYSDNLSSSFARLDNWDSPYLTSAAYETLKSRGLDLVMDPNLAVAIVWLFEKVYVSLISDHDRQEWINYEVSMVPLMLAHVEERPGDVAEPINYDALLDNRAFRTALLRTLALRIKGSKLKREAIQSTREVIQMIDTALEN